LEARAAASTGQHNSPSYRIREVTDGSVNGA
jgi:hypothetical protein